MEEWRSGEQKEGEGEIRGRSWKDKIQGLFAK